MTIAPPSGFRGIFRQDADARAVYSEGAGIQRIDPVAVAVPVDADDLGSLVKWARREGAMLIPRGSGSGMAGGAIGPGVIVDLSRWKDIGPVDISADRVVVGPGAICADVNAAAGAAAGAAARRLPVDPSSAGFCTIGGMTATNAAGAHTLGFGSMRDWVMGVECLFVDGSRQWIRRSAALPPASFAANALDLLSEGSQAPALAGARHAGVRKESSGYATSRFAETRSLVDLLVGSEGTLAFFTAVEIKVTTLPGATASVMGVFPSLGSATDAAIRARAAGAVACELLDRTFLEFVATASGKPFASGTEAILLADAEGESAAMAREAATTIALEFARSGADETRIATDPDEREALWSLRHAASPTLARLSDRLRSMQFIEDAAVPPDRLGDYVTGVRAALDRQAIRGVIFGHAGDAHVHVNPLIDVTAPDWRRRLEALLEDVTALVASVGGTLSGEHGDGRLRTPLLSRVWSAENLAAFAAVKRAFDPYGMLNRGVKSGVGDPLGAIKYDPESTALPRAAARALEHVEQSRGYSDFRLDLLEAR